MITAETDNDGHQSFNDHFALAISTMKQLITQQGKNIPYTVFRCLDPKTYNSTVIVQS